MELVDHDIGPMSHLLGRVLCREKVATFGLNTIGMKDSVLETGSGSMTRSPLWIWGEPWTRAGGTVGCRGDPIFGP